MKFFLSGLGNSFDNLALIMDAVIEADRLGFDGAIMPDHYMWGEREWSRRPDNSTLETWVMLSYLAGKTEQIRLGTLVTPIPFRPPSILSKMISTLDILSRGRVVLGVGAGWSREKFEGYSEWNEPKVRVEKTREGLELMIRLWTEDEVTFEGEYYQANAAVLEPKPVQKPYPQILFGGRGDRMLKLAGRYADICYPLPRDYENGREKVLRAAEKVNRVDKIAFMAGALSSTTSYNTEEYFRKVEAAIEVDATYFLAPFPRTKNLIDSIRSFAREVMPSFK
jgi:alkanesulfonate monooxygenase SsuD/methylene tetrahydromethanopterin reductase-like flavin-dependent oxidoreductase (luciferase family)